MASIRPRPRLTLTDVRAEPRGEAIELTMSLRATYRSMEEALEAMEALRLDALVPGDRAPDFLVIPAPRP